MCRRQTLTTLCPAERGVAEQHYRLVEWYVRHRGLPVDEYLDVAVFGYLLAVKRWFARPDLYRYEFTIAGRIDRKFFHEKFYGTRSETERKEK